ncbi:tripartite-type tricarboxylate transporter receptor subunit TctC [Bradyrhizobium sp. i1.3.6]
MSAELFKVMTKCDMVHVPYRGSAIAFPDIISNKVQLIFDNLPSALEQSRGGTVRALGVTSPQRWPTVPDVPAIAETVPGFESVGFYGISAPKGTPPEVIEILNKAVGEVLKDPKVIARLTENGGIPKPMTSAEFGKLVADETEKWKKVVEFARGFGGLGVALRGARSAPAKHSEGPAGPSGITMCENNPMHSRKAT